MIIDLWPINISLQHTDRSTCATKFLYHMLPELTVTFSVGFPTTSNASFWNFSRVYNEGTCPAPSSRPQARIVSCWEREKHRHGELNRTLVFIICGHDTRVIPSFWVNHCVSEAIVLYSSPLWGKGKNSPCERFLAGQICSPTSPQQTTEVLWT